jgi:hypothetical protein
MNTRLHPILIFISVAYFFIPKFGTIYSQTGTYFHNTKPSKFIKNIQTTQNQFGNLNELIEYIYSKPDFNVSLHQKGFSYDFFQIGRNDSILEQYGRKYDPNMVCYDYHRIDVNFIGANSDIQIKESEYGVTYINIYPGIDIDYIIDANGFKYNIIAHSKESLEQVEIEYTGALDIHQTDASSITLTTAFGDLEEQIPYSYYTTSYPIENITEEPHVLPILKSNRLTFKVTDDFPNDGILVIDPLPHLQWASYSGGSSRDELQAIQVDDFGNTYIAGFTQSTQNIATTGSHQGSLLGIFNGYLQKYDSQGQLVWGTYYGGSVADRCYGLKLEKNALFLCGSTFSGDFIATPGVHQTTIGGQDDAFLAKFSLDGDLIWGTYFGGEKHDFFADIAIDSQDNIIVTGHTTSEINIATIGAHLDYLPGVENAILAKFNPSGQLIWSTYFGNQFDEGWGIDVDSTDHIYFTGLTTSSTGIASPLAHQTSNAGNQDAFLVKFGPNGNYIWGTYFGGDQYESGKDIVTARNGDTYIVGTTGSPSNIATTGAHQETMGSIDDSYLAKFDHQGNLIWSTYIGGDQVDVVNDITFDQLGKLILTGYTQSSNNIAVGNAFQSAPAGLFDAMILVFDAEGNYHWGTYFGGELIDEAYGVAVDPSTNHIVICGYTQNEEGITTPGVAQENYGGGILDGFVARFCVPPFPIIQTDDLLTICSSETVSFEVSNEYDNYDWSLGGTAHELILAGLTPGNYELFVDVIDSTGCPGYSDTLLLVVLEEIQPEIILPANSICEGDSLYITTSTAHDQFLWSLGDTTSFITTESWTGGIYDVYVTVQGNNQCSGASDTIQIEVYGLPDPIFQSNGAINFCTNEPTEISTQSTYYSYQWFDNSNEPSVTLSEETLVWVNVSNEQGCEKTSDTILVNSSLFLVDINLISSTPICEGDTIQLAASSGFDNYQWSNGLEGVEIEFSSSSLELGSNALFLTVFNACGDSIVIEIEDIVVFERPDPALVLIGFETICPEDSLELSTQLFTSYHWSNGALEPSITIKDPGSYWVQVMASNGCFANSDTIQIELFTVTWPTIESSDSNCIGTTMYFSVIDQYTSYMWSTGETNPQISVEHTDIGSYTYTVEVTDDNGCLLSDTLNILIEDCLTILELDLGTALQLYPNPASSILTIEFSESHPAILEVFDMQGNLIYCALSENSIHTLLIDSYSAGTYTLRIHQMESIYHARFVVR